MCRHAAWSFPPDATSPAAARHAIQEELSAVVAAGAAGDALVLDTALVVSELVTNAVVAGCRSVDVELTIHRSHLVLTVTDDAPGRPRPAKAGIRAAHGRGLRVVERLARAWTVQTNDTGKTVRVEIATRPGSLGALLCDPSIV